MQDTFESNLSASQKEEMANQQAYEDLKVAKEADIAAGQAQIDFKTQELADTDEKLAHAKEDIEDTTAALAVDEQFLMMLKEKVPDDGQGVGGAPEGPPIYERNSRLQKSWNHSEPELTPLCGV